MKKGGERNMMLTSKTTQYPTSKLVFYQVYREECPISEKKIDQSFKMRMKRYRLDKDAILKKDQEVIIKRGNKLEDYHFDCHKGFRETLQQLHCHLLDPNADTTIRDHVFQISLNVSTLTFSELYLYHQLLRKMQTAYDCRIRMLEEHLENQRLHMTISERNKIENNLDHQRILQKTYTYLSGVVNEAFTHYAQLDLVPLKDVFHFYEVADKQWKACLSEEEVETMKKELQEYEKPSSRITLLDKNAMFENPTTKKVYAQTKTLMRKYGR